MIDCWPPHMPDATLFTLSVTFALVTGVAAGVLALLSWEIFRASPFGRALFALTAVMSAFTLYHALLLVSRTGSLTTHFIESGIFTGMALVVGTAIWSQRRLRRGRGLPR